MTDRFKWKRHDDSNGHRAADSSHRSTRARSRWVAALLSPVLIAGLAACSAAPEVETVGPAPGQSAGQEAVPPAASPGEAPVGDFELMRVPDPESEMSCEQYGEVASVLTENMHYTGHVWVSFPTQLRCNWKSEPGIERVMSAPFEFELTLIGGDDTSERIWADYLRNVDRFPERIVRQESTLVESLGGVIYEGSAIVDRPERESMQMDLPGVSVSALTKCMEEYLNADGTACANMPAGFTSENKVQVLERVAETIATFQ